MYPQPMTNDPDRVAPDHRIHLPGPTPVRPRRPMAAVVLSVLLGLSCFAASPTWAYKAGAGADDRPWNVNIKNYKTLKSYRDTPRSDRIKDTQVTIGNSRLVYRVTDLEARITANTLSEDNLPDHVDHLDSLYDTVAVGADAYTETRGGTAIGSSSSAIGNSAIAIGNDSGTQGRGAIAIGRSSRARSQFSIAIGQGSRIQNPVGVGRHSRYAVAVGSDSTAVGIDATSLGSRSNTLGQGATALGSGSDALGDGATALGYRSQATSEASTAIGHLSWAVGRIGSGAGTTAVGVKSRATGEHSAALGGYANAIGSHSTAVGRGSHAYGANTVAVGRGAMAGGPSGVSSEQTGTYLDVAEYLEDPTRTTKKYVMIGKNVYQVTLLEQQRRSSAGLTKNNIRDPWTSATAGGVAVGVSAAAEALDSIALGRGASATGTKGIAIGSGVSAGANEVVVGTPQHTSYKLPGLGNGITSGTRTVMVDKNGQLSIQSASPGTASRGAGALSSDVTALNRNIGTPTEAADYEEAPAIGSGPNAPATAEQRRVVVQDTNRDGSVRLRTLDLGDLSGLDRRVTSLSERLNKATAMSSALSALPNVVPGDNRFFLGVGVGHYSSEQALAVGMSARIESSIFVNAGVAVASGDDVSVRGGVGVVW